MGGFPQGCGIWERTIPWSIDRSGPPTTAPMASFTATTREVVEHLQIGESTLRRMRAAGVLRPGIHFCAAGVGTVKPILRWDIPAIDQALASRSKRLIAS